MLAAPLDHRTLSVGYAVLHWPFRPLKRTTTTWSHRKCNGCEVKQSRTPDRKACGLPGPRREPHDPSILCCSNWLRDHLCEEPRCSIAAHLTLHSDNASLARDRVTLTIHVALERPHKSIDHRNSYHSQVAGICEAERGSISYTLVHQRRPMQCHNPMM